MELGKAPVKRVTIGKLSANERCVLQRKRAGCTQIEVAKELGVCRWWLNQMESGKIDCTPLSHFWDQ